MTSGITTSFFEGMGLEKSHKLNQIKTETMNLLPSTIQYQESLSIWAGCKAGLYDDFDIFCDSDFDFIEILMLFEKEFSLNLLETTRVRQDFTKVREFISWADAQPTLEEASAFSISYKTLDAPDTRHCEGRSPMAISSRG